MTDYNEDEEKDLTDEEIAALADKAREEEEELRKHRAEERVRFLTEDLEFNDMYRQSCARVYYMKSRRDKFYGPDDVGYDFSVRADKLLAKYKHAKKRKEEFELRAHVEQAKGQFAQMDREYDKADEYTKICLWSQYGIGVLYGRFVREKTL